MSRNYKNIIKYKKNPNPNKRRENLRREPLRDSTPLPKPLIYEDYDKAFKKWVDEVLYITFENEVLPSYSLYSNQRFNEYMQTWQHTDENKNVILNFKTIKREPNPQQGTLYGDIRNIPGDRLYTYKKVYMTDENDRGYFLEYKMKQPFCVDLKYNVSIFCNKFELLNRFNELVNNQFKAINTYMNVNGHYIGMKLDNISDESEYEIDDRQYYSQSFDITVLAYIITEDSFSIEETPMLKFMGFEGEKSRGFVELEELPCQVPPDEYYDKPCDLNITFGICDDKIKFTIDTDLIITAVTHENIKYIKIYVNDNEVSTLNNYHLNKGDEIKFTKLIKKNISNISQINYSGYIPNVKYDIKLDDPEFKEDFKQFRERIDVEN